MWRKSRGLASPTSEVFLALRQSADFFFLCHLQQHPCALVINNIERRFCTRPAALARSWYADPASSTCTGSSIALRMYPSGNGCALHHVYSI
ncbi:uncharacterized protein EKO05_0004371 [Ascochyta rabiei]|uniref:uncharacterized protein n=1 Tax=Didymella rabiei TaxID=5454 RepID=UPI00220C0A87|nr:uncharacterized protein EKO05_0004371 [Ascochyta rabiei]UPX13875.1 hypothetical protein EKO05_0004371 [Ascochyta rabiei]